MVRPYGVFCTPGGNRTHINGTGNHHSILLPTEAVFPDAQIYGFFHV